MANTTVTDEQGAPQSRRRFPAYRYRAVIVGVVAVIAAVALHLWNERPLRQAQGALASGDAKYAHYLLEKFLAKHPDHLGALALQARVLVNLGRPDEALVLFDRAGAADVADVHAWARALMLKQQWTHAIPLLRRVLSADADDPDALYELAACLVHQGKLPEALSHAERLAKNPPHAARALVFVGTIQGDLRNFKAAAEAFTAVLTHEPLAANLQVSPEDFFQQYGLTLLRLGDPQRALAPLKQSAAIRETPGTLVLLGEAALQLGHPERARQAWDRALLLEPLERTAREGLANLALQEQDGQAALSSLEPLAELPDLPSSTSYLFQRAYTLLNRPDEMEKWRKITDLKRQQEERTNDLESLLVDAPESLWARALRAHHFAAAGNFGEAEILLRRLIQEAPAEPFIIELADAVFRRATLPSLDRIPLEHF